jgi:hypothetical protein
MSNRLYCSREAQPRGIRLASAFLATGLAALASCFAATPARGGDTPAWMKSLVSAPVPAHDDKTDAVLLYSEDVLSVQASGKIKSLERRAYKILRPNGKGYGTIRANFDSETKITGIHGWCIPASGKDYEVKDKDALETALFGVSNGELVSDVRTKVLQIPAADPGNIVGYEIEHEDRPYVLQDEWTFQHEIPTREAKYTLQLPSGWEYKAVWLNYPKIEPTAGNNQWQWAVSNVEGIRPEDDMPPWTAVAGMMVVSFFPPGGGQTKGFENWNDMALWQAGLVRGRRDSSPEIKQKVAALTASETSVTRKMAVLGKFVQDDVRYVAIQLGIGGWQPHAANDIFTHHFGDCKDKATLLSTMLKEIGIDSYYVAVNTERGTINENTPATRWFNHMILAIKLPDGTNDPSLTAVLQDKTLGRLLIFDPTDDMTPFGYLRGELQANFALLVTDSGGELVELPKLPASMNGTRRTAKLTLTPTGTLTGDVSEIRLGDRALYQRLALRSAASDKDKIKPIESMLAESLPNYRLTHATVTNVKHNDQPFGYDYSLVVDNYAKAAGNLLLVRPRVLGSRSSALLETKEPRKFPVEFQAPSLDSDTFEIALPAGYEVSDLPPPVDVDYDFASYHSKTEASGNTLKYTRRLEVKQLTVPVAQAEALKKFYRIIASDERNTAVLQPSAH